MSKEIEVGDLAITLFPETTCTVRVVAVHGDKCAVVDIENDQMGIHDREKLRVVDEPFADILSVLSRVPVPKCGSRNVAIAEALHREGFSRQPVIPQALLSDLDDAMKDVVEAANNFRKEVQQPDMEPRIRENAHWPLSDAPPRIRQKSYPQKAFRPLAASVTRIQEKAGSFSAKKDKEAADMVIDIANRIAQAFGASDGDLPEGETEQRLLWWALRSVNPHLKISADIWNTAKGIAATYFDAGIEERLGRAFPAHSTDYDHDEEEDGL